MKNLPNGNWGTPVEANVAAIDKELASFWKSAGGSGAVTKACSLNLVTIVKNRSEAEEFSRTLASIAACHPNRSIIAYLDSEEAESPNLRAWTNVQCSVPLAGDPHVCCEIITLAARDSANLLPITLSLLAPDLPACLYCRSFLIKDRELVETMARFCQTLIVDSHQSRDNPENRLNVLELLADRPAGIAMRDLNWARITAWRDLISQFFDSPATREYVHHISKIEITGHLSTPENIPTRTLLLTGWIASQLGWQLQSSERSGDQWRSIWRRDAGEVASTFTGTIHAPGNEPGIYGVLISAGDNAEFTVTAEPGSSCLLAGASIEGDQWARSVPQELMDESSLLIKELLQQGEDDVFRAALKQALELEKSFSQKQ